MLTMKTPQLAVNAIYSVEDLQLECDMDAFNQYQKVFEGTALL